jgi:hypothetical protein
MRLDEQNDTTLLIVPLNSALRALAPTTLDVELSSRKFQPSCPL